MARGRKGEKTWYIVTDGDKLLGMYKGKTDLDTNISTLLRTYPNIKFYRATEVKPLEPVYNLQTV